MKLVGFNFNKISVEKQRKKRPKELKIDTNIDISEITTPQSNILKTKEELLAVTFSHSITYKPDFAKLLLDGSVVLSLEPKTAKNVLKEWKKKKLPADFKVVLFNVILSKTNVKALELEEEVNLPYHIPLPSLRPEQFEEQKKK